MGDPGIGDGVGAERVTDRGQAMTAVTATLTWLALIGATILGWVLAGAGGGGDGRLAGLVVISCAKIYLVMTVFMGLWRAPRGWHGLAIVWIVVTGLVIFGITVGGVA